MLFWLWRWVGSMQGGTRDRQCRRLACRLAIASTRAFNDSPAPCLCSAVASHPVFSVKGWDPTRSAREALLLLKAFLEVGWVALWVAWCKEEGCCVACWWWLLLTSRWAWGAKVEGHACSCKCLECCCVPQDTRVAPAFGSTQEHARVDFSSDRNTTSSAAYLPVEVGCGWCCWLRLSCLTTRGWALSNGMLLTKLEALAPLCSCIWFAKPNCHLVIGMQVLLAKLEALTGTEAAAQSMQQYEEMYR